MMSFFSLTEEESVLHGGEGGELIFVIFLGARCSHSFDWKEGERGEVVVRGEGENLVWKEEEKVRFRGFK